MLGVTNRGYTISDITLVLSLIPMVRTRYAACVRV